MRGVVILAAAVSSLFAQSTTYVASAGYGFPGLTPVARGQVISLFVRGVYAPNATANTRPLPTTLSGITVVVTNPPTPGYPTALPILSVTSSADKCGGGNFAYCNTTNVVVQFPYEPACIKTSSPNSCTMGGPAAVTLVVKVNGVAGQQFSFSPYGPPHFLNTCDTIVISPGPLCNQQITHADGSLVGSHWTPGASAAHPGELITIDAVGLGPTPKAQTGQAVTDPDPLPNDIYFTPAFLTGSEHRPQLVLSEPAIKADWAGLVPGAVGLYKIKIRVPATLPSGIQGCGSVAGGNLRLILGAQPYDVSSPPFADVCVATN